MRRDCGGRARYAHRRERDRGGLRDLEAPETLPLGLIRRWEADEILGRDGCQPIAYLMIMLRRCCWRDHICAKNNRI